MIALLAGQHNGRHVVHVRLARERRLVHALHLDRLFARLLVRVAVLLEAPNAVRDLRPAQPREQAPEVRQLKCMTAGSSFCSRRRGEGGSPVNVSFELAQSVILDLQGSRLMSRRRSINEIDDEHT